MADGRLWALLDGIAREQGKADTMAGIAGLVAANGLDNLDFAATEIVQALGEALQEEHAERLAAELTEALRREYG